MKRFYYISNNLNDLEKIEHQLEDAGITKEQIHVLSNDDIELARHHIHSVTSFMKKDVVHSTVSGAGVGVIGALLVLAFAMISGVPGTYSWTPFVFLAIVVLGFCTWEGGLYGIQEPNKEFKRFNVELNKGKHILFVDIAARQSAQLESVIQSHKGLQPVGTGRSAPWFVVRGQEIIRRWAHWGP